MLAVLSGRTSAQWFELDANMNKIVHANVYKILTDNNTYHGFNVRDYI